ncbi:hypothetical protein MYP_1365 [Sporocytophaga myxococcoides]|uniref:Uncharacterized protein n=1 Tax=Sporocytophaga myxococcoides TaxID=153721 RepID=A0A098LCE9_9BACT|nr:hypothetical protein MYP_1365 [Sporocytophaga myxococcoides]
MDLTKINFNNLNKKTDWFDKANNLFLVVFVLFFIEIIIYFKQKRNNVVKYL